MEGRHKKLIAQLKSVLVGTGSSSEECSGVLEYFLDKLSQSHITPRKLALKVSLIVCVVAMVEFSLHGWPSSHCMVC